MNDMTPHGPEALVAGAMRTGASRASPSSALRGDRSGIEVTPRPEVGTRRELDIRKMTYWG